MRRKQRKHNISLQPKYLLYALVFLCLLMIYFSYRYRDKLTPIKTSIGNVVTPMQNGINEIGSYITDKFDLFQSKKELLAENEELKKQIEALKFQNDVLVSDTYDLSALRELYDVGQNYAQYPMIAASVISKDTNGYYSSFIVNKGSNDGITKDMNVISDGGLVGIVTETGANWSRIRAIIDDTSYASGMFLKTSDTCDVHGSLEHMDNGFITVESISLQAQVEDHYEVVTSQISDKYLPGIMIGYVFDVEIDASRMAKMAKLIPVVDFDHIKNVLIITKLKEKTE